jgi:hypothetical protein
MRTIIVLALVLLTRTSAGQFEYLSEPRNLGQAIGEGAERAYSDLLLKLEASQRRVKELEAELAKLKGVGSAEKFVSKITVEALVDTNGQSICPACEAWWNGPDPVELRRVGWEVDRVLVVYPPRGVTYPRWRVCVPGECFFINNTRDFMDKLRENLAMKRKAL